MGVTATLSSCVVKLPRPIIRPLAPVVETRLLIPRSGFEPLTALGNSRSGTIVVLDLFFTSRGLIIGRSYTGKNGPHLSLENKYAVWQEIEVAVRAQAELGVIGISREEAVWIRERAAFNR